MARGPFRSMPPHAWFARLPIDEPHLTVAKNNRLCSTPIPAGVVIVSGATPGWRRIPQGLAVL